MEDQQNQENQQIIKTRDDPEPVTLEQVNNESSFKIKESKSCSWAKSEDEITPEKLRERIEPWLTALFQSEHLQKYSMPFYKKRKFFCGKI